MLGYTNLESERALISSRNLKEKWSLMNLKGRYTGVARDTYGP